MEKPTNSGQWEKRKHEEEKSTEGEHHGQKVSVPRLIWKFWEEDGGVLFTSFLEHGLSMPASQFLEGLLFYYKIQLHHFTPESVLHISVFVHFCEAFLGIEPHFEFFRSLYTLKPLPSFDKMGRVGCVTLELRPRVLGKYLEWPRVYINPSWQNDWFYISNPAYSLPKFSVELPEWLRGWLWNSTLDMRIKL